MISFRWTYFHQQFTCTSLIYFFPVYLSYIVMQQLRWISGRCCSFSHLFFCVSCQINSRQMSLIVIWTHASVAAAAAAVDCLVSSTNTTKLRRVTQSTVSLVKLDAAPLRKLSCMQLISSKCIPILFYGLEVLPMQKYHLNSLDFVINRFLWSYLKPATFVSSNYAKNCSILCSSTKTIFRFLRVNAY